MNGIHVYERRRLPRLTRRAAAVLWIAGGLALGAVTGAVARADELDAVGAIHAAADNHGVAAGPLLDLARCESRFVPSARGDHGHSHGLMQLSDLRGTGLLWHFYAVGYTDAYSAEQSSDYVARVAAGEWAREGVTLGRWSCWPR